MPPPPEMDAYLKSRLDKLAAQLAVSAWWGAGAALEGGRGAAAQGCWAAGLRLALEPCNRLLHSYSPHPHQPSPPLTQAYRPGMLFSDIEADAPRARHFSDRDRGGPGPGGPPLPPPGPELPHAGLGMGPNVGLMFMGLGGPATAPVDDGTFAGEPAAPACARAWLEVAGTRLAAGSSWRGVCTHLPTNPSRLLPTPPSPQAALAAAAAALLAAAKAWVLAAAAARPAQCRLAPTPRPPAAPPAPGWARPARRRGRSRRAAAARTCSPPTAACAAAATTT